MLLPEQDAPSPTYLIDDSDTELSVSLRKNPEETIKKFHWGDEKLESLIKCWAGVKADYEIRGLDFESDPMKLYSDVRAKIAEIYGKK